MTTQSGLALLLDLPQAAALREGDGLLLSDGRMVRVHAAPEPLLEIVAPDITTLVRVAWHLGNRHLPTQVVGDRLRIRRDHVIRDMVRGLGAIAEDIEAPFDPEGGAFAHGKPRDAGHGSEPANAHADGHAHEHPHDDAHHEHLHRA